MPSGTKYYSVNQIVLYEVLLVSALPPYGSEVIQHREIGAFRRFLCYFWGASVRNKALNQATQGKKLLWWPDHGGLWRHSG